MTGDSLIHAASEGNLEGIRNTLRHPTPETNSSYLLEALAAAALNGHLEIVKVLLRNGADINCRGKNGHTPLSSAVENLEAEIVKYLLEKGADVNTQDEFGTTVLHQAIDCEVEHAKSPRAKFSLMPSSPAHIAHRGYNQQVS